MLIRKQPERHIRICTFLICLVLFTTLLPPQAAAIPEHTKPVRIGWFQSSMFQEGMSDDQEKSGYCYDYIQKVSNYTNWKYEYIYGDWTALYRMLQNGEIDLLGGVSFTEERQRMMLFPDLAMGTDRYYLYKHNDDKSISADDLSTLSGKKVGGVIDNRTSALTEQWLESNTIDMEIVYFQSFDELQNAFSSGIVDLLGQTIFNVLSLDNISLVAEIGEEPFYLAVNKERPDLLEDLNFAINTLLSTDPFLLQDRQYKNYGGIFTTKNITDSEKQWLQDHPSLVIGYFDNYLPYSDQTDSGEVTGLVTDMMDAVSSSFSPENNITLRYEAFEDYEEMIAALNQGSIDIAFPVSGNLWQLEQAGICASSPVLTVTETLLYKGNYTEDKILSIAVNKKNGMQLAYCRKMYPNANLVYCNDMGSCMDAVLTGVADGTILNTLRAELISNNYRFSGLSRIQLPLTEERCFGVDDNSPELLMLLNRGLSLISTSYGLERSYKYIDALHSYDAMDYVRANLLEVTVVLGAIVGLIIILLLHNLRRKEQHIIEIAKAKHLEQKHQRQIEEQLNLVNTLSRDYLNVYIIEPVWNLVHVLKLNGYVTQGLSSAQTDYPYDEVCRKYIEDRVFSEDAPRMTEVMNVNTLQKEIAEADQFVGIYRILDYGEIHYYQYKYVRIHGSDSIIAAFQNVDNMIAAEKAQQKELRDALLEAKRANAAKSVFLARMSHDIRTPLNGILGLLELSERHPDDAELVRNNRSKEKIAANHLLALINDVLELSKLEDDKVQLACEAFNLVELTEDILAIMLQSAADHGVEMTYSDRDKVFRYPYVYGSPLHVRQILINIISNAIKYNRPGGTVHCSARMDDVTENTVTYSFLISDTGIGMSPEFLEHVFEPFCQERNDARSTFQGTGLGMSIVKNLVDRMGGCITVESEAGKGSTFTVSLSFVIADQFEIPKNTGPEERDISGVKVLLAEDNMLNMEIASTILKDFGASVTEAHNGKEAFDLFRSNKPGTFDVILMDLMMPVLDGYGATEAIRSCNREDAKAIPIIAMTANAFVEDKTKCLAAGMNGHLSKPIEIPTLIETIADILK